MIKELYIRLVAKILMECWRITFSLKSSIFVHGSLTKIHGIFFEEPGSL